MHYMPMGMLNSFEAGKFQSNSNPTRYSIKVWSNYIPANNFGSVQTGINDKSGACCMKARQRYPLDSIYHAGG